MVEGTALLMLGADLMLLAVFLPLAARTKRLVRSRHPGAGSFVLITWMLPRVAGSGKANVLVWLGLVASGSRTRYRFTVERIWVRVFRGSTKLDGVS